MLLQEVSEVTRCIGTIIGYLDHLWFGILERGLLMKLLSRKLGAAHKILTRRANASQQYIMIARQIAYALPNQLLHTLVPV